jgi:hypothetical protein
MDTNMVNRPRFLYLVLVSVILLANCSGGAARCESVLDTGVEGKIAGYNSKSWTGKYYPEVPKGRIVKVEVLSNTSEGTIDLGLMPTPEDTSELASLSLPLAEGWASQQADIDWPYTSLLIYQKDTTASVAYSTTQPWDEMYRLEGIGIWLNHSTNMGYRVTINTCE